MADSKDRFYENPADCKNHIDRVVYTTVAGREQVHQCPNCGWGYIHNLETGNYYG